MLSVARSPLASPALRTVTSASPHAYFPFHSAAQSSPRSLGHRGPLPHMNLPGSPRTRQNRSPSLSSSPTLGGYFNLEASSPSPSHLRVSGSPRSLAPPQIAVQTPPVSTHNETHLTLPNVGPMERKLERLTLNSAATTKTISFVAEKPTEARARRRPSFKLGLPRPNIMRDDSFEAVALAGITCTPGTPGKLRWSDSCDSVVTLKPTKGRVPTPYPTSEGQGQWIEDVDAAVREGVHSRIARLL